MNQPKYQIGDRLPETEIGDIEKTLQDLRQQLIDANLSEEHLELTIRNLETLEALTSYKLRRIMEKKYSVGIKND